MNKGYLAKIAYWMWHGDIDKMQYFIDRQEEVYGRITPEQGEWVCQKYNELEAVSDRPELIINE